MTDKELLQEAAKAANLDVWWTDNYGGVFLRQRKSPVIWDPLNRNDDAFSLAAILRINITHYPIYTEPKFAVHAYISTFKSDPENAFMGPESIENYNGNVEAAIKRAIVNVAVGVQNQ